MHSRALLRIGVFIALLAGLGIVAAPNASAQEGGTATITIHKAECYSGVGSDIFEDCHDNGISGVDFAIQDGSGTGVVTTDEDGHVTVTVQAGDVAIMEDPNTAGDYAGQYVYCRDLVTDTVIYDGSLDGATTGLGGGVPAGANIVCDVYNITAGGGDDGGHDGGHHGEYVQTVAVTQLPVTGAGATGSSAPWAPLAAVAGLVGLAGVALRRRLA